jgi:VanZ family protein
MLWWVLAFAWAGTIAYFSSSSDAHGVGWITDLFPHADKAVHAGIFGVLAVLLYLATGRALFAIVLTSMFGALDELHQATVLGRNANVWDWVADTLGAILGVAAVKGVTFLTRQPRKPRKALE